MGRIIAGLAPHPPLIIPQIGGKQRREVRDTIDSLEELGAEVAAAEPDLLITISPHGPVFQDAVSVPGQETVYGDFADFGCPEVSFEEETDLEFVERLGENARAAEIELVVLSDKSHDSRARPGSNQLDHGVLVPWHFFKKAGLEVPLVALTMGLLPYEKLFNFGYQIKKTLKESGQRAVVIASGDLSHRLQPGAPAGYNPRGAEFDRQLMTLLEEKKFNEILDMDSSLVKKAGECGLRPLIIMLGSIKDENISVDVKSYEGPFGVGYGVTGFYLEEE